MDAPADPYGPGRSRRQTSPTFLEVLAKGGVNIVAAGGGDVEKGGEFAFAVAHGKEAHAMEVLKRAKYEPRLVDVDDEVLDDKPGELHRFITKVATANKQKGLKIRDVSVGVPVKDGPNKGKIAVQVYSEPE